MVATSYLKCYKMEGVTNYYLHLPRPRYPSPYHYIQEALPLILENFFSSPHHIYLSIFTYTSYPRGHSNMMVYKSMAKLSMSTLVLNATCSKLLSIASMHVVEYIVFQEKCVWCFLWFVHQLNVPNVLPLIMQLL